MKLNSGRVQPTTIRVGPKMGTTLPTVTSTRLKKVEKTEFASEVKLG